MLKIMKASAGSGKTFHLAKTYIELLLGSSDRYAYRHILAVTFTNKATDEMKSRILKELHTLSTNPLKSNYCEYFVPSIFPDNDKLMQKASAVLHDILHDYSAFAISTIDRFFQQALKAFSREIGQFASYQVELDKNSLIAESVDRLLDSLTVEDTSLLSWLTDNVLEQIVQGGRYSMDANLLGMAMRLKSNQRQEAIERSGFDEDNAYTKDNLIRIRKECRDIISAFREEVKKRASSALNVLIDAGVNPAESNNGFLKALYVYAELTPQDKIMPPKDAFFKRAADSELWFAKTKAKTLLPKVYPFLEAPLEDFCNLWDKEFQVYNTACILDGQIYGLGVAGELRNSYLQVMKEKNVLSLDDSNTILRDIIDGSDAPFIYEKLGVRFDHFLLDEFQDTSAVQWGNFSPLIHNSDSQGGSNLIVGDVKQSIYRWRGSDWKLLDEEIPSEFPGHEKKVLEDNYRSLGNIVRFNNGYFTAAAQVLDKMSRDGKAGSISRIYEDVVQTVKKTGGEEGRVSVTFCDKEKQLQMVLEAVQEALEAGAKLSDVAILVRNNSIGEAIASYLIDNGISVMTDDSLKVKNSVTVRRLMSLLSYMDNRDDTVNGFLATSLDVEVPESSHSLTDMAEGLIRSLKAKDKEQSWKGEIMHIQSFMDHLQDYVSSNGNSLRGFLKYWENEDPSISSPSSGNSVRIMTIHKSKGLAFQYVIIPFAESIKLYKADNYWCDPDLEGTVLDGVAEGVYDVKLSESTENSLFVEHYRKENFLQHVDNINTLYVAMTRAVLGMHIIAQKPSNSCCTSLSKGDLTCFADFSQILYWYLSTSVEDFHKYSEEGFIRYDCGEFPDFSTYWKKDNSSTTFPMSSDDEYPSYALNHKEIHDEENEASETVERGRLRLSADASDFFSEDGDTGIEASNRIKGVVLHDVLARVIVPADLDRAISEVVASGDISVEEVGTVKSLLSQRLKEVEDKGWFPHSGAIVLNERDIIDSDGEIYRPDRVVKTDKSIVIIDYKFGEHHRSYERKLKRYADIWKRMGYEDVTSYLWYVHTGEILNI